MTWTPGRRHARQQLETPFEGVPSHLTAPLVSWVANYLNDNELVRRVGIEFRIQFQGYAPSDLSTRCVGDVGFHLDLIEYLLETQCAHGIWDRDYESAELLEETLAAGNSAYKVNETASGLEMRTTPEVQAQVQQVVDTATGSAGEHLADAWNAAYSRTPDPVKSYSESVKAVEAALAQHVSPQNARQTLGTMIKDVSAKPLKWKFAIADGNVAGVETVLHMMRLVWDGQTSRHGGINPTRAETEEEAQAAVHLAATLVQFGVGGAFSVA